MKITVAGHICLDMIPDWRQGSIKAIKPGHMLEMEGIKFSTGGAVANTGLALQKLGIQADLIGKIGKDYTGKIIIEVLQEKSPNGENIVDNMIVSKNEESSYSIILEPPDTDRIFLHSPGTNHTFNSDDLSIKDIKNTDLFHFGYPPVMKKMYRNKGQELAQIFQIARQASAITSLDMTMPDPKSEAGQVNWKGVLRNVLPYVDIFLPSLQEIMYMLNYDDYDYSDKDLSIKLLEDIGSQLLKMGTKVVVLKLGEQGLYLQTDTIPHNSSSQFSTLIDLSEWNSQKLLSPCFKTRVQGTTGAGDSAIAGFLSQIIKGKSAAEALNMAAAVGACCVEEVDATGGIIPLNQVEQRIQNGWSKSLTSWNLNNSIYDNHLGLWKFE